MTEGDWLALAALLIAGHLVAGYLHVRYADRCARRRDIELYQWRREQDEAYVATESFRAQRREIARLEGEAQGEALTAALEAQRSAALAETFRTMTEGRRPAPGLDT